MRTVVGVMPKRFMWRGADVYLPVTFERGRVVEGIRNVHLLGRLKPGVTEAQAAADLEPIIRDLALRTPLQYPKVWRVGLLSFKETFPSSIREDLWVLFGAVGLLLLIACANVSNLLLSRAAGRQREMAVRAALGGSRWRLVRQLLTESVLLAMAGGVAGTALAYGALRVILTLVPPNTIPDESEVALNVPVLLFALAVSAVTSVIFGLAPAIHTCTRDLTNPLRSSGRSVTGGTAQTLLRKGLVVAAVALSIMLMVGASLMIRTVLAVGRVGLGFQPDRVLTLRVPLPERKYPDPARRVLFFEELLPSIARVPGVTAAAVNTSAHPFGGGGWTVEVPGSTLVDQPVVMHQVSADYTRALGIALLKGRGLTTAEVAARRQIALVNQAFERSRFNGGDAVGRIVRLPRLTQPPIGAADASVEIVGVVHDTLNRGITDALLPEIYIPYSLLGAANRVVVQTAGDPAGVTRAVVERVYAIDRDQPVTEVRTIEAFLNEFIYAGPRFNVVLLSVFAFLGLVLSIVGVYGVMAHTVRSRRGRLGYASRSAPIRDRSGGWSSGPVPFCSSSVSPSASPAASLRPGCWRSRSGTFRRSIPPRSPRRRSCCSPRACWRAPGRRGAPAARRRSSRCVRSEATDTGGYGDNGVDTKDRRAGRRAKTTSWLGALCIWSHRASRGRIASG